MNQPIQPQAVAEQAEAEHPPSVAQRVDKMLDSMKYFKEALDEIDVLNPGDVELLENHITTLRQRVANGENRKAVLRRMAVHFKALVMENRWLRGTLFTGGEHGWRNTQVILKQARETLWRQFQRDRTDVEKQVDKLAGFILAEVPGEPSRSEGAIETAMRVLKRYLHMVGKLTRYVEQSGPVPQNAQDPADVFIQIAQERQTYVEEVGTLEEAREAYKLNKANADKQRRFLALEGLTDEFASFEQAREDTSDSPSVDLATKLVPHGFQSEAEGQKEQESLRRRMANAETQGEHDSLARKLKELEEASSNPMVIPGAMVCTACRWGCRWCCPWKSQN